MTTLAIIYAIGVLSFGTAFIYSLIGAPPSEVNFRNWRDLLFMAGVILCWPIFLVMFIYDETIGGRDDT